MLSFQVNRLSSLVWACLLELSFQVIYSSLDLANAFVSPGVNSRGELVPSHGASRRGLGDKVIMNVFPFKRVKRTAFA